MKVKAITSFSGVVSMRMGEIGEIADPSILNDLVKAGYVETLEEKKTIKKKTVTKGEKK